MREGWKTIKLEQVSEFQGGSQPPKSQFIDEPREGYIRLLQIRDFKSDHRAVYIPITQKNRTCLSDDIMIGRYGASVGQIHRGKSGAYNVALIKTIPNESIISKDFFYLYLISDLFQRPLSSVADRSAQDGFSKSDIALFEIMLPPLPEQKCIVAILDEAFEGIDRAVVNAKKNLANARELFESYLNKVFTQKGEGWVETSLGEAFTFKGGGTPSKKVANFWNGNIPWVSPKDMKFDEIGTSIDKITAEAISNSATSLIPIGAILIVVRSGILAHTIPIGITTCELSINQDIKALCPNSNLDKTFLRYLLLSKSKDILKLVTRGATVHRLSTESLKALRISLPPLSQQKTIKLDLNNLSKKIQRLEAIYSQKLTAFTELKQSLLQKGFSGELTADAPTKKEAVA